MTKRFMTAKETAAYLGFNMRTLERWRAQGEGPEWHEMEGRIRYDVAAVDRYIEQTRRVPSVRAALEADKHVSL